MNTGSQPVLSKGEVESIEDIIKNLESGETPPGYDWLPEMLRRLAWNKRFNRRNFVNIHPTPHVPSVLASTLVSLQNPNNIVKAVSGPTTEMEEECIRWLAQHLLGFDQSRAWGNVVSGGTIANLTALMVARDYCYRKLSRPRPADVRQRGLFGLPSGVVMATAGSHYSIKKALWLLGIGDENVVTVPVSFDERVALRADRDRQFIAGVTKRDWRRRICRALDEDEARGIDEMGRFYAGKSKPFSLQPLNSEIFKSLYGCFEYGTPLLAYVFTLGTTDTGTIESPDLEALDHLAEEDIFIHADAAAGGFALQHTRVAERVIGMDKAHSATLDGHKFGHLAYPNGAIVFREKGWVYEILHEAPYLQNLAPTLEGSRPGSHVAALWAAIEDLGKTGRYGRWLDRIFVFVDALVECFEASKYFQVLHDVHLSTVAVAPVPTGKESRTELNRFVVRMGDAISNDDTEDAFLVNVDRGLSGIKVRNSNRPPSTPGSGFEDDPLVDLFCLRIVATNPAVERTDASKLVDYLEGKLEAARAQGGR